MHWFRNDLRLTDNPALSSHISAETLLLIYLMPKPRAWCNLNGIGTQRDRFLRESLQELKQSLREIGQDLMVLDGSPELVIPSLVERFGITEISVSESSGFHERKSLDYLDKKLEIPISRYRGNSLFDENDLPYTLGELPRVFSKFRRAVEKISKCRNITPAKKNTPSLPPPPAADYEQIPGSEQRPHPALPIRGGRSGGLRRLRQFIFDHQNILHYKLTRNCLNGLDGSSTLSPWLANGNLSVREVCDAINQFELTTAANESTYWLFFELLWREFFYWREKADGANLFRLRGFSPKVPIVTYDPRQFARWAAGDTTYPIVNALMRQLQATGWMTNRGRQIAASCWINECQGDWRYGAAFFEKHLIDYDVGSNYGNWQYIAGVGSDPRGGRHFNIERQTLDHDPNGVFVAKWGGGHVRRSRYL